MSEEVQVRPFAAFLQEHGNTHDDLSVALQELVVAVAKHGKSGTLMLKLTVKPAAKGMEHVLSVMDQITVKAPAGERAERIFYSDEHGNLTRRDPRQPELPGMRALDGGKGVEHDEETGEVIGG